MLLCLPMLQPHISSSSSDRYCEQPKLQRPKIIYDPTIAVTATISTIASVKATSYCYVTTAIVASVLLLAETSRMIVYPFACLAEMGCQTEANKPSFIASTSKSILSGCSLLDAQIHNCGVRHLLCVYLGYGFETSSEILPKSAFARSICQAQLFAMFVHNTTRRILGSTWSSQMMPKKNLQQRLRDSGMS